jgi:probable sporulation protein (polysaccharide deacetylase family)
MGPMKLLIKVTVLLICLILPVKVHANPQVDDLENPALMNVIKKEALEKNVAPIDARIDTEWGVIPGYNGLEIDIEKTYDINKWVNNFDAIQYFYKEVPVKIHLEDLKVNPIYRGNPEKPMVSLMINVAWGNEYIPQILQVLKKYQIKTTFFFDGSWLNKNVELAKVIQEQGHELSNHAYSHKNMSTLGSSQAINEIAKTEHLLRSQLGVNNTLFAPPSGDFDMETVKIAHGLKLKTILWTLDTVDWQKPSPQSIVQKIDRGVKPGYLILMHPTMSSSQALESMIQSIKRKGLEIGTVSEVISESRIKQKE